jgi:phosphoribosylanthranilate isomerase
LLARGVSPFVAVVGLFVNPDDRLLREVCEAVPLTLLQLHGDESPQRCAELGALAGLPWLRACAVGSRGALIDNLAHPGVLGRADLVEYAANYAGAKGLLLDAVTQGYGGGGKVFDWSLIPEDIGRRAVLSGGLNEHNVRDAIAQVRPYAVDVSSGVEVPGAKGVKDLGRITAFIEAVQRADTDIKTGAYASGGE